MYLGEKMFLAIHREAWHIQNIAFQEHRLKTYMKSAMYLAKMYLGGRGIFRASPPQEHRRKIHMKRRCIWRKAAGTSRVDIPEKSVRYIALDVTTRCI